MTSWLSDATQLSISLMVTENTQIKTIDKCLPQALIWEDGEGKGGSSVVRGTKNRLIKRKSP